MLTLQRTLLSEQLPVLPGIRIAAHYLVAGDESFAGGDWFDALPLGEGQIALAVGDVVGHGASAAAVMAQLRAVLLERLLDSRDLATAVDKLDRFAGRIKGAMATTLVVVLVDTGSGALSYVCCGHPPPLVVGQDGARFLENTPGQPLGIQRDHGPIVATDRLAPGEVVMLFSDGLVERRDQTLQDRLTALADVVSDAWHGVPSPGQGHSEPVVAGAADAPDEAPGAARDRARLLSAIAVEQMADISHNDDVTVLALERVTSDPPPLSLDMPAELTTLAAVRRELRSWLRAHAIAESDVEALVIAVNEAVTNTIEHAYTAAESQEVSDDQGSVSVTATLTDQGEVHLSVVDGGHWREPLPDRAGRGRGFPMMRGFVDAVEIDRADDGTRVHLTRRVHATAVLETAGAPGPPPATEPEMFTVDVEDAATPVRVTVTGPIDAVTLLALRRAVRGALRETGGGLVIDLTGVSLLGSAAVSYLHELATQLGPLLRVHAPTDSIALQVMTLTGLEGSALDQL